MRSANHCAQLSFYVSTQQLLKGTAAALVPAGNHELMWHTSVCRPETLAIVYASLVAHLYVVAESRTDVTLEVSVPFWIEAEDVTVDVSPNSLHVNVRNELDLHRTCWQNR